MPITYPPPSTTLSSDLTVAQVHYLLKNPTLLAKRVRDISLFRYIGDYILTGRYRASGGAILYPNGEPIFANDDPEQVGVGGEYPLTTVDAGTLAMAKAAKIGRDAEVYDESISRMLIDPLNRALTRLVNSNVRYFDAVCLGVVASKITRTRAAGASWSTLASSGEQIVEDIGLAVAETSELEDGFDITDVVLKPTQYAKVRARLIAADLLPREEGNPLTNGGTGIFNYMGLTWATSMHSPVADPLLLDRDQLGGIASEDIQSPDYATTDNGIEVKSQRITEAGGRDGYRVRVRRNSVPVVVEPNAGIRITGTGI